jgi:phosphopantothenoylcysteine decarboxylase/phosphopantothenate--cysteine ligase
MKDFINKKIVLGICGGIAAFKSAELVRTLSLLGAKVRVVMSKNAAQFVTPITLQALSGYEVRSDLFDPIAERAMGHIELARWADFLVIAPATANCLASLAHGLADDLLSTLYLVTQAPVLICPAMNHSMWSHEATQMNVKTLLSRGALIVGPEEGPQACGEFGDGRMSEVTDIIEALRLQEIKGLLEGKCVVITAGPTRELIDPVRYISNQSSGKMGYALAEAAKMAGAAVTLVSGPTHLPKPKGVDFRLTISAEEMCTEVMLALSPGVIFIGAAAVADFSPSNVSQQKIKKDTTEGLTLELKLNQDILSIVAQSSKAEYVVGFAAETTDLIKHAMNKLDKKRVDMIVANLVGPKRGFDEDVNEVVILTKHSQEQLPLMHKTRLAGQMIAILARNLQNALHKKV